MSKTYRISGLALFIAAAFFLPGSIPGHAQDPTILTVGDPLPGVDVNLESRPPGEPVTFGVSSDWKLNLGKLAAGKYHLTFKKKIAAACRTCRKSRSYINVDRFTFILDGATAPIVAVIDLRRGTMFNPITFAIEPLREIVFETSGAQPLSGIVAPAVQTPHPLNDLTPVIFRAGDPIKDSDIGLGQNPGGKILARAKKGYDLKMRFDFDFGQLNPGVYFIAIKGDRLFPGLSNRCGVIVRGGKYGPVGVIMDFEQNAIFNPVTYSVEPLGNLTFEATGEEVIEGAVAGIAITQPGIKIQ
jgi:hypothetical protein